MGNPLQSYRASLAIWDHTVLPATRHTRPTNTTASQAGTRFTYPGGMEGWVVRVLSVHSQQIHVATVVAIVVATVARWFIIIQTATKVDWNLLVYNCCYRSTSTWMQCLTSSMIWRQLHITVIRHIHRHTHTDTHRQTDRQTQKKEQIHSYIYFAAISC